MQKFLLSCAWMLVACSGCETASDLSYVSADAAAANTTPTDSTDTGDSGDTSDPAPDTSNSDGFSYNSAIWGGESYAGAGSVDMSLNSASVSGGHINFSYNMNNSWPSSDGVQAVACMFMKRADGSWYGGKFDFIRTGGQSLKETVNIDSGYGAFGSERPHDGQTVAFIWVSLDKEHRSNEAVTTWH